MTKGVRFGHFFGVDRDRVAEDCWLESVPGCECGYWLETTLSGSRLNEKAAAQREGNLQSGESDCSKSAPLSVVRLAGALAIRINDFAISD